MIEVQTRKLTYVSLDTLKPDTRNPRKHGRPQIQAIARSVEAFGFNAPILVDREGRVLAGHGRLEAAKLLAMEQVPVIFLDNLSEAQAKAYMLADNKLSERSSWDENSLALHLKELSQISIDFDIEATGFELAEIDYCIQSLDGSDEFDKADEFDFLDAPPISLPGDLWHLGDHRLFCGSTLEADSYKRLLGAEMAATVFTDPPYNVKIGGNVSGLGKVKHREFAMASGEMSKGEFTSFLTDVFEHIRPYADPGALLYACIDWRHLGEMLSAGQAAAFELLNLCVWVKSNGGMGSLYRSKHELVFVFKNGSMAHRNNVQLGRFGRNRNNVWNYPGANSFPRKSRQRGTAIHPTVKPIALIADALLDCTVQGDIVLDPFLGSGTTILAAERTRRRGYGIEIDPSYVDTSIRRWQTLTGKDACLSSGKSFSAITTERSAS